MRTSAAPSGRRSGREYYLRAITEIDGLLSTSLSSNEIVPLVGEKLAELLGIDNFVLAEAHEGSDKAMVLSAWRPVRVVGLLHEYRLSELIGGDYWRAMWNSEAFAVSDTQHDSRTDPARHAAFAIGAFIVVPYSREGKWKYLVSVDTISPRAWTADEVDLVKETGTRMVARYERALAEESLRRSEERLRALVSATSALIYSMNADWSVMQRFTPEGLQPAVDGEAGWMRTFIPAEDHPAVLAAIEQARRDKTLFELEHRMRDPGGETRWMLSRAVPLLDEHGDIVEWFGQSTDITERRRTEEALRASEERHRALAEENERLYRQQLRIAENLQVALLTIPSEIGRVKVGHLYHSATEAAQVGGDFYDVFQAKDGTIAVVMGDVSGHGIEAARTATLVKDVVEAFTHQSVRTNEVLRHTNALLVEKELPGFVTLFLGLLDPVTGVLRYSSAGHPETMLRRESGEVEMLVSRSAPLGVYAEVSWRPEQVRLGTGDLLLLYTDGVIEARRGQELFGEERLKRVLRRKRVSIARLPHLILDQVHAFTGGSLHDDLAILTLSLTEAAPRPGTGGGAPGTGAERDQAEYDGEAAPGGGEAPGRRSSGGDAPGRPPARRGRRCLMAGPAEILDTSAHRMIIPADLSRVGEVRDWVAGIARAAALSAERVFDLQVVTSEAVANGIEHAQSGVEVTVWTLPDRVLVEVTNDGVFQPGLYKDDDHRRRGLGLPLMVALADQVHVSRLANDKTMVSLTFFTRARAVATVTDPLPGFEPAHRGTLTSGSVAPGHVWGGGVLGWLAPLPACAAILVVIALLVPSAAESQTLLTALNTLFITAAGFAVAYLAGSSFLRTGSRAGIMLGTGAMFLALGSLLAGPLLQDVNRAVTVFNVACFLAAALFTVSGALACLRVPPMSRRRRVPELIVAYLATPAFIAAIGLLADGPLPRFYRDESGPTALRTTVLVLAAVLFLVAVIAYSQLYRMQPSTFVAYSIAAFAFFFAAMVILAVMQSMGTVVSWGARAAEWIAGIYLLAGVYSLRQEGMPTLALERRLEEARGRYSSLVELTPDAVLVHSRNLVRLANPAAARLLGFGSPEELIGKDVLTFFDPALRDAVTGRVDQVLAGSIAAPAEETIVRATGETVDVEVTRSRVEVGGELAVQTVARDITERKRDEAALVESEQRYRTVARELEGLYRAQVRSAEHMKEALLGIPDDLGPVGIGRLYRAATDPAHMGGDFYDAFKLDHHLVVLVGDVAGHGIPAARTAILTKDVIHAFALQSDQAEDVLERTNALLVAEKIPGFVTLFMAILDLGTGRLRYASAGHPEALLIRASRRVEVLGSPSAPLGIYADAVWRSGEAMFERGDVLVLYTDGVTEARRSAELFGDERLRDLVAHLRVPVERMPEAILERVLAFSEGELRDDVAIFTLAYAAQP